MEANLKFNLPEDNYDFQMAINGSKYYSSLWDLDQHLRGEIKHGEHSEKEYDILQATRDKLRELMNENNVSFLD